MGAQGQPDAPLPSVPRSVILRSVVRFKRCYGMELGDMGTSNPCPSPHLYKEPLGVSLGRASRYSTGS